MERTAEQRLEQTALSLALTYLSVSTVSTRKSQQRQYQQGAKKDVRHVEGNLHKQVYK